MGLLIDLGPVQDYKQTQKQQKHLKQIGLRQFFHRLRKYASWKKSEELGQIKWGQEIEGHFLKINSQGELELCKEGLSQQYKDLSFPITIQYGSWMFEMTPNKPHNTNSNFYDIVTSIRQKYAVLHSKPRIALTIPVIPFLGVLSNDNKFINEITQSIYVDDGHVSNHPRFQTLTNHIRMRRGDPIQIYVPIFQDINTNQNELSKTQPRPSFIHMDATTFGLGGCCCLQCTFSTKDFDHARYVYDMLNVISPIFLALTAGSPFFKGKVSDWDVRWNIIADSADDRSSEERDETSTNYIPTSRYNEANYYIWDNQINKKEYNDFYTGVKEQDVNNILRAALESHVEVDEKLAFHLANIFKRDFVIVHSKFKEMSEEDFILFDMINGTNWNSVRLKIPIDDEIGWRVEFRTMDNQLTDDQNSAFSLFIHLITRVLHENNDLNLYIPITALRENFKRAHKRNSLRAERFYFRTNIHDKGLPVIEEMTIHEILFGKGSFKGLFYEIERLYEGCVKICPEVYEHVSCLKKFVKDTTSGKRLTLAQWMRDFIQNHPGYDKNSILTKEVMKDLILKLNQISKRQINQSNFARVFPTYNPEEIKQLMKSQILPKNIEFQQQ